MPHQPLALLPGDVDKRALLKTPFQPHQIRKSLQGPRVLCGRLWSAFTWLIIFDLFCYFLCNNTKILGCCEGILRALACTGENEGKLIAQWMLCTTVISTLKNEDESCNQLFLQCFPEWKPTYADSGFVPWIQRVKHSVILWLKEFNPYMELWLLLMIHFTHCYK